MYTLKSHDSVVPIRRFFTGCIPTVTMVPQIFA